MLSKARDAKLSIYKEKSKQGWQMNYTAWNGDIVPENCRRNKGQGEHNLILDLRKIALVYAYMRVSRIYGPRHV